jgi:hypothetical protein
MYSGSCLTSKLYDKIIKMLSKSHETILLSECINWTSHYLRRISSFILLMATFLGVLYYWKVQSELSLKIIYFIRVRFVQ